MKDIVTPASTEEVRAMIKKSLENAALLNYTRLCSETKMEGGPFSLHVVKYLSTEWVIIIWSFTLLTDENAWIILKIFRIVNFH